jgi:hypothetical protein
MGLFSKLFGSGPTVSASIQDSVQPFEKQLKSATKKKNDGDLNGAIDDLKAVYDYITTHPTWFSPQTACRLPLYLAEAKRSDEAWTYFNQILNECDRYTYSYTLDKMRLFLQRDGKPLEAVKYGVMSYIADMSNMTKNLAEKEIPADSFDPAPMSREQIEKLLKKAKRPDLFERIDNVARKHFARAPKLDMASMAKELNDVLYN